MTDIINFCNDNQGFVSAILSFLTIILSVIAIGISIHTAKIPYKKKIKLELKATYGYNGLNTTLVFLGYDVEITNLGNMPISITYFGIAVKEPDGIKRIYTPNQKHDCILNIGESNSIKYDSTIGNQLQKKDYFLLAQEPNGKKYIKSKHKLVGEAKK